MEGWTNESFAILWHYKIRLYNMSHSFYNEKESSGWVLIDMYKSPSFELMLKRFKLEVDNVQELRFILINSS
jgi:hypothetical protein